jgi:hypothetical protein
MGQGLMAELPGVSACHPNAKHLLISLKLLPTPHCLCLGRNCLACLSNSVINCFGEDSKAFNPFPSTLFSKDMVAATAPDKGWTRTWPR